MTDEKIELTRRKILAAAGAVGVAGAGAGLGTSALYKDSEGFTENAITAGTLDLSVTAEVVAANQEYEDAVGAIDYLETADGEVEAGLKLTDIKPGDWAIVCVGMEVLENPGCVTATTSNLANDENTVTEPEAASEAAMSSDLANPNGTPTDSAIDGEGELAQNMVAEVYGDFDGGANSDPPRSHLSNLDDTTPAGASLAEFYDTYSTGVTIGGGRAFNQSKWYLLLELPRDTGNVVQSDSVSWDFTFDAIQARNNPQCSLDGEVDCTCPEPAFSPGSTDDDFSNLLSVGPDPDSGFPNIDARVRVDTPTGNAGDLTASNFAINENGCGQTIENVAFEPGGAVDIVVVFDDTGSMGGEISTLQSKVTDLTTDLDNAGVDARYALVSFNDEAELDQDFTADVGTFDTAVDSLSAIGGGDSPEDNLDALAVGTGNAAGKDGGGASLSAFRSGAQRVIIDITDAGGQEEGDHTGTDPPNATTRFSQSEVEAFLDDGNFTYYAVAPSSVTEGVSKRDIANNVDDGTWLNINDPESDFGEILNDIVGSITDPAYVLSYTTACMAADGAERTVDLEIDDPDQGLLYETGSYTAPGS